MNRVQKVYVKTDIGHALLALLLAIALFWGEPDVIDFCVAVLQALAKYLAALGDQV